MRYRQKIENGRGSTYAHHHMIESSRPCGDIAQSSDAVEKGRLPSQSETLISGDI